MIASNSPQARRSEIRCLQDLGDLRQLSTSYSKIALKNDDETIQYSLDKALDNVVQETKVWARQHEADGRYRDAEFLFRRASFNKEISPNNVGPYEDEDVLPTLVSIYEKMSDYPAAEMGQETLLRQLFPKTTDHITGEQKRAVSAYSKMLSDFQKRVLDISSRLQIPVQTYINLFIIYRLAILDIPPLNEVSLERSLFTLESNEDHQCTSLHIAVKENAIHLAHSLIEKGTEIDREDVFCCTPLHRAAQYAEPAMIELLLDSGANIEAVDGADQTPLHRALIGKSDQQKLELLINAKVQMEARDNFGRTALMVAIQHDLPAAARFLVQRGANVEKSDQLAEAPLLLAVGFEREWAIRLLTENGASLVERGLHRETALYLATKMAQESVIQILLGFGAMTKIAVDQQNIAQDTCLCCAVNVGNTSIVEMLLHAGADIYARGFGGRTALHEAVTKDVNTHKRIVHLLLMHSAPLDTVNILGKTVFHLAVYCHQPKMVSILIQYAKPAELATICETRDYKGRTPLDLARRSAREPSDAKPILHMLESALGLNHSSI